MIGLHFDANLIFVGTYHQIMEVMKGFGWPGEEYLKNLMSAILRVQYVHNLGTAEVL